MADLLQSVLRGLIQAGMYAAYRPKIKYDNPAVMDGEEPCVFICNHMSHKDGALIASVLHKKKPYFLIAKDWYEQKRYGVFLRRYGSIPVDREGMDTGWFDACKKQIEAGHSILIFPEGRTSKEEMREFQPGFAVLAEKTGAPVVEVTQAGNYKLFFGERKKLRIGDSYRLECPKELRKSQYAKQVAAEARTRMIKRKSKLEIRN
ncbi:MAG: 1-acyl-sn-glycerol-3-phosphate acyltransferase [Lachnospiraceae bacterium]|nr:1-acyl-sn-glycerol-3-phosphate acyltransferase [Lachnospiraceae bacterium]